MSLIAATVLALCPASGERRDCIVDGDTLWLDREKVRLANIDSPELDGKCPQERAQALRARDRLHALLQSPFVVWRTGEDRYGRTLARVTVNGRDIGAQLVSEGYAREWRGRRLPWCPIP